MKEKGMKDKERRRSERANEKQNDRSEGANAQEQNASAGKNASDAKAEANAAKKEANSAKAKKGEASTASDTAQGAEGVTLTKEEFEQAREQIARMKKSMDDAVTDAQRIQAEFNNFRKRNATIRSDSIDDGIRETIKNLLPVLDNFERALANSDDSPFAKGIVQIQKQLIDVLKKSGLEEVEAEGMFDPNMHEAVLRDDEGEGESGTITAVLQKGYRVRGKIIRHTMVKVKA